jgi:O-acetyl-ADP-ribose deacetylase (regulator of RNase III)
MCSEAELLAEQAVAGERAVQDEELEFEEVAGDIFDAVGWTLCHCVGADLTMGAGIAIPFRERFGGMALMRAQRPQTGGMVSIQYPNSAPHRVYALVTKQWSSGKPAMADLRSSLEAMATDMALRRLTNVAMPRLGCGLDGLDWSLV